MSTTEFQIEFTFDGIAYIGIVSPIAKGQETWYRVNLESENQENYIEIIAKPPASALEDWNFECEPAGNARLHYDKDLLNEIGEAIEKYNIDRPGGSSEE